jgi:NAD(P)-dependent dehydrogenase (short-subunit alcohol dehydrogenase family)
MGLGAISGAPVSTDWFSAAPRQTARRWGVPEDFGGLAVHLASDASRYHTGDTFVIDGGNAIF